MWNSLESDMMVLFVIELKLKNNHTWHNIMLLGY
jgi:hypothetical protein